ncbi:hypothetical protein NFI96_019274 [Prochilodus magdalenae]|nr:hypothetical protein NFI96_019274 [Prochilodus magdalenae]
MITAACLIFNLPKFTHVTPLLRSLHWLPVVARIRFKTLMLAYKAKNGPAPHYLIVMVNSQWYQHWPPVRAVSELMPTYLQLLKRVKAAEGAVRVRPEPVLQDGFQCSDWEMFKSAATTDSLVDIHEYATSATGFVRQCVDDVTQTKQIRTSKPKTMDEQ